MIKYDLSPAQKEHLAAEIRTTAQEILMLRFSDTSTTERDIRERNYLQGRLDALTDIFTDNYPEPDPVNEG